MNLYYLNTLEYPTRVAIQFQQKFSINQSNNIDKLILLELNFDDNLALTINPINHENFNPVSSDKFYMELAKLLSEKAHKGQTDKAGVDYFKGHISSVVEGVTTIEEKTVAYLHDVIEDTIVTKEKIEFYFPKNISEAVFLLTKSKKSNYDEYIKKIKSNSLAKSVKLSDLNNNSDLTRIPNPTEKDKKRTEKYLNAIYYLNN